MKIGIRDAGLLHAPLEQVLASSGFVGLCVLLAEHIAFGIVAVVLFFDGHLDTAIQLKAVKQLVHDEYPSAGVVCLGGGHCLHCGGCRNGIVVVRQPVPGLADQK